LNIFSPYYSCSSNIFYQITWSQNGELVCIATEESYYVLRYNPQAVVSSTTNKDLITEDGIEDAFDVNILITFH